MKELQQTKEEMSDAFMKLHSFAMSNGFLDTIPAFAKELHSTTEKFLMLAKKSSECSGENSRATSPEKDPGASEKPPVEQPDKAMSRDVVGDQPTITGSSVWGYRFSTEAQTAPALTIPDLLIPQAAQPATTHAPMGYEIITMPTVDNASFPFEPNAQESFFAQGIHPAGHQILTPNETPPGFSLSTSASASASLPMPNTLAFAEPTFGRRLQRSTIEFACRLSSMPNPPGDRFAKAFGFCLLFEPIDQIRARLHRALEKTRQESLNNWRVPFWALGGAGQHQLGGQQHQSQQHQQQQQSDKPVGNQGTVDVEKHAFGGNFGFGPFDAGTTEARDRHVDASMHIMLPGFQGDFFDPDEVEVYLQSRGVCIQPGQDYVTAEVDMSWFEGQQQQQQQATGSYGDWASEMPPPASRTSETTTLGGNDRDWVAESVMADEQAAASLLGLADGRDLSLANQRQVVTLNVDVLIQGESRFPLFFFPLLLPFCLLSTFLAKAFQ